MAFKIKASYTTGDSFHTEDAETTIDRFESREVAEKALERLKEHYNWYNDKNNSYSFRRDDKKVEEPEWHKGLEYDFQVSYYLDNGELLVTTVPYCGYFEHLNSLEIKKKEKKYKF
jgi:hypothetical protein